MAIMVKVLKPTAAYPVAGKVYEVEPSARVAILLKKRYIERVGILRDFNPVIVDEPDVEVPILEDEQETETVVEDDTVEDDAEEIAEPVNIELNVQPVPFTDDRTGWIVPEDDEDYVAFGVTESVGNEAPGNV